MKDFLSGLSSRKGVSSIATAGTALALVMVASQAAQAVCAVAGSNVTCTGATSNGAPPNGFGDGTQTGINLSLTGTGASVTSGAGGSGILIKDGQVNVDDISANVQGLVSGIVGNGPATLFVFNSGTIVGGTGGALTATRRPSLTIPAPSSGALWERST